MGGGHAPSEFGDGLVAVHRQIGELAVVRGIAGAGREQELLDAGAGDDDPGRSRVLGADVARLQRRHFVTVPEEEHRVLQERDCREGRAGADVSMGQRSEREGGGG